MVRWRVSRLLCLTAQSALQGRSGLSAWQYARADTPGSASVLWLAVTNYYRGEQMLRIHVSGAGLSPPGFSLPADGEVVASPAMRRLFESTPDDQLDDRHPGRVVGTIPVSALAYPEQLVAVVGGQVPGMFRAAGIAAEPDHGWLAYEGGRRWLTSSLTYRGFHFHAVDVRAASALVFAAFAATCLGGLVSAYGDDPGTATRRGW